MEEEKEEEKKVPKKGMLDLLFDQVRNYKSCDKFKGMMDFCTRFRRIAPYNAMLLEVQMPSARYVLTSAEWKKRFGRKPKDTARPLITLIPFGPVEFLYEIGDVEPCQPSHTPAPPEGHGNPRSVADPNLYYKRKDGTEVLRTEMTDQDILEEFEEENKKHQTMKDADRMLERLKTNLIADGIIYEEMRSGIELSGQLKPYYIRFGNDYPLEEGYTFSCNVHFKLSCRQNATSQQKLAYICHELGHFFCHHLTNNKTSKWWPQRLQGAGDKVIREFEAESVAWLVCSRLGIATDTIEYLNGYFEKYQTIPDISMDLVLKASMEVEKRLRGHMNPREGLMFTHDRAFKLALLKTRDQIRTDKAAAQLANKNRQFHQYKLF